MMMRICRSLILLIGLCFPYIATAQIDVDHVISIGRNALYFNDYVVSIGYFNRVIDTRPWMAEPYLYRSIAKISLEDYSGTIADATMSIQQNPYITRSYLVRGVAYQNLERYEEAIEDYRSGLRLSPDNGQMWFNKAVAELRLRRLDDAERSIDTLLMYSPRYNEAYALRANLALEKQDTTLALQRVAEAVKVDPSMSMPYRLRAAIHANRNQWYDAIAELTQVIELGNQEAELYSNRAIMHYQVNNLKGALADYTKALELKPKDRVSLNNRAILHQQVGEKRLALKDWNKLIELEPTNYIARYNRAMLTIETGQDLRIAVSDLDAVLKQYPSFADGFMQRSILKRKLGDTKGASDDYWHANRLVMNKQSGSQAYAQALTNKKRLTKSEGDLSIDKYSMLIEGKSNYTPDARYTSKVRGRVQDRDVAIEQRPVFYLTFFAPVDAEGKPLPLTPYYSPVVDSYNAMGDSLRLHQQAREEALTSEQIKSLEELLAQPEQKGAWHYYLRRGIIHSLLQDYEQAIMDYNRALALDTRNLLVLWARSIASMRYAEARKANQLSNESGASRENTPMPKPSSLDFVPNAMQDLGQLLMLAPDFAYAYYNRAVLYAQNGNKEQAIEDYTRAIELAPRLAEAYYNRGLILLSQQKTEEGIQDLSKAGELGLYDAYNIIKRMK